MHLSCAKPAAGTSVSALQVPNNWFRSTSHHIFDDLNRLDAALPVMGWEVGSLMVIGSQFWPATLALLLLFDQAHVSDQLG